MKAASIIQLETRSRQLRLLELPSQPLQVQLARNLLLYPSFIMMDTLLNRLAILDVISLSGVKFRITLDLVHGFY